MEELICFVCIVLLLVSGIRMVPQDTWYLIERMGAYYKVWDTAGHHYKLPLLDRIANKVPKTIQRNAVRKFYVPTIDGDTFEIEGKLEWKVTDPIAYTYTLNSWTGIERNILFLIQKELECVNSRDMYNHSSTYQQAIWEKIQWENTSIEVSLFEMSVALVSSR